MTNPLALYQLPGLFLNVVRSGYSFLIISLGVGKKLLPSDEEESDGASGEVDSFFVQLRLGDVERCVLRQSSMLSSRHFPASLIPGPGQSTCPFSVTFFICNISNIRISYGL